MASGRARIVDAALLAAGLAATAVLLFTPLVDGSRLVDFTLDDAYITFRYAGHLADGLGPVWNPGSDPVEGFTTFLWVVVIAAGDVLGAGAETVSKVVGAGALAAALAVLALYGGRRPAWARIAAVGGLALSPAFALIAIQGMETSLAAALALAGAIAVVALVREPSRLPAAGLGVAALLGMMARPDLGLFFGACIAGVLARWALARDRAAVLRLVAVLGATFALPGLVYFLWRWSFYGYPLPNTYYVKQSPSLIDALGLRTVRDFVLYVAGPYLAVAAAMLLLRTRREGRTPEVVATWILLAGVSAVVAYGVTFYPEQGYLYRFQMPVYPVALLTLVLAAGRSAQRGARIAPRAVTVGALAAGVLLALFPLHLLGETRAQVRGRWQYDRKEAGLALAPFRRDGLSMLVTEAGAVPLYSGWRATDHYGLNDEGIAHHGVTYARLRGFDPDLVMMSVIVDARAPFAAAAARRNPAFQALFRLLRDGRYRLAAAIEKTSPRLVFSAGQAHFYWLKPGARDAGRVARALGSLPTVRHLEPAQTRDKLALLGLSSTMPERGT
jgi:hypothetical protein